MDKTRTLPPLVRGKVTGVLNFFVDEIRIFRNNLLLIDNFDLVLQVQWWGESLPAFLRPKKLQVQDRNSKNSHSLESYYHLIKYEIKTTLDLFKTYLKSCERVEFCVLEISQKYVIGSVFLRELPNLLNSNNKPIKMPIFNYLGIVIGEVIIRINFLEILQPLYKQNQNEIVLNEKNNYSDKRIKENEGEEISKKIKSNYFILGEKTLCYNINSQKKEFLQLESSVEECELKKNKHIMNPDVTQLISNKVGDLLDEKDISINQKYEFNSKEFPYKCFPEIKTANDSSKVLYFGVSLQRPNSKVGIKCNSAKVVNKFNSNSIKCKSKSKYMENTDQNLGNKKLIKKSESSEDLSRSAIKINRKNQFHFKDSVFCNSLMLESLPSCKQTDLQSIISKESSNSKIFDYLLGSDMSKDDEEIALNNFKKMSPSHNLVNSISQLCLDSNKNVQISENNSCFKSPLICLKPSPLNFDFSNPIERNYYSKFFLKSDSNADFEVAEFLNLPESRVMFEKLKFNETPAQKNGSQNNGCKDTKECLYVDKEIKNTKSKESYLKSKICVSNKTSNCACCKYYKKLDELDTIIKSLKHFEQKMLKHNKDLQLDFKQIHDVFDKRNII